ncbi:MAG: c-type cytochrome biogenesis protein CcmI [Rhodocyclales bacterium]|nr:c-type cytochrome biogenesis protein CcmI [Rhodocyclales bacterium]
MTPFLLAAAALVLAVLLLLLRPWWRPLRSKRRTTSADFSAQLNTTIHRDRLAELDRDRASGVLAAADYAEAREELQRQLLDDTAAIEHVAAPGGNTQRRHGIAVALALLLPASAVGLYALLGTPAALVAETARMQPGATEMEALVTQLAQKMEKNPDDPQGWVMLARSYKALGRWEEAERAFAHIPQIVAQDAALLADRAEVLAQHAGSFEGEPRALLAQALRLDANATQALLLSGVDAFENKRYAVAIGYWQRLLKVIEPGSENTKTIEAAIARARERLGQKVGAGDDPEVVQSKAPNAEKPASSAPSVDAKTLARNAVSGRVELAPALRAKAAPEATVFIFARAVNGPRMPLAVKRVTVADLPLDFSLDDSMAMQPGHGISSAAELRIEVRVSKSGQAMPGAGDLTGASAPVRPGAKGVRVVIDTAGN